MNPRRPARFVHHLCRHLAVLFLVPLLIETGALPSSRPMARTSQPPAETETSDDNAPDEDDGDPLLLCRRCESQRRAVAFWPRRRHHGCESLPSRPLPPRHAMLPTSPTCPIPLRC